MAQSEWVEFDGGGYGGGERARCPIAGGEPAEQSVRRCLRVRGTGFVEPPGTERGPDRVFGFLHANLGRGRRTFGEWRGHDRREYAGDRRFRRHVAVLDLSVATGDKSVDRF